MIWQIKFRESGKVYSLQTVDSVTINESVDTLADTAEISLPEMVMNEVLNIGDKIKRGSEVKIKLGYDETLVQEFVGYVQDIVTRDSSLKIICEDALFLFRVGVKNEEFKMTSIKNVAQRVISQVNPEYRLVIDGYGDDVFFEKFVIHQATGYDVLKKLAEESKANIYFNTDKKELHIHPPYLEKGGDVTYSMQVNVESSSLEYKKAIDRKLEVTVEMVNSKGKVESYTTGTTGGDKVTVKAQSPLSQSAMESRANAELIRRSADGYEGSLTGWLVPVVKPTYSAKIIDEDYPDKTGKYYVIGVTTEFNSSGGKRTVKLGVKVGV
jgi:phage protein D